VWAGQLIIGYCGRRIGAIEHGCELEAEAGNHLVGMLYLIEFSVAIADVGGAGSCVTAVTK